jgi:hypothetical protein
MRYLYSTLLSHTILKASLMKNSKSAAACAAKKLFVFSFLFINAMVFGQDTLKASKPIDIGSPVDLSLKNKWYYFKLNDTISVKVIDHLPLPSSFGLSSGSLTIVETQRGDIIRIIDPVNEPSHYRKGQLIKVAPASKPSFDLAAALVLPQDPAANKKGLSSFDLAVQKTTWGSLLINK